MVSVNDSIIPAYNDFFTGGVLHCTGMMTNDTHTGVSGSFRFHSGTDNRHLCLEQRNGLTLHVGTHQGTVGIVIFQERNHGSSHGKYHLRRYIHVIDPGFGELGSLIPVTSGNIIMDEMTFFIQRLIGLCHCVIIFLIRSHVCYFIRNDRIFRIALVHLTIRSFNKSVFIDSGVGCQGVDQTDVRTFRGLDGAHSSIMGIMNITNLKTGTVSGKTTGSQGG